LPPSRNESRLLLGSVISGNPLSRAIAEFPQQAALSSGFKT